MDTLFHADAYRYSLARLFAAEWDALSTSDRNLIVRDCTEDGGVLDLAEYRRSIGQGNLAAYARTQRARFGRQEVR